MLNMLKKIMVISLVSGFLVSCTDGRIRNYLNSVVPYLNGEYEIEGLVVKNQNASVRILWTADPDRTYKAVIEKNGVIVASRVLPAGSSEWTFDSLENYTEYKIRICPFETEQQVEGLFLERSCTPGVVFVDPARSVPGDGSSWQTAINDLNAAMSEASDMNLSSRAQVRIAKATILTPGSNATENFVPRDNIALKGGFDVSTGLQATGAYTTLSAVHSGYISQYIMMLNDGTYFSNVSFENLEFFGADNTAGNGSAVYMRVSGTLEFRNCLFTQNRSSGEGGAIYIGGEASSANLVFSNCSFEGNSGDFGGAIYVKYGRSITLNACTFNNNYASTGGGAIQLSRIITEINDCLFTSNHSDIRSGAIGAFDEGINTLTINNSVFTGNYSGSLGGALNFKGVPSVLNNTEFKSNYSGTTGGAVYSDAEMTVSSCRFTENFTRTINSEGGALYFGVIILDPDNPPSFENPAACMITDCVFEKNGFGTVAGTNFLTGSGGAVYTNNFTSFLISRSLFIHNNASSGGAVRCDLTGAAASLHMELNTCVLYDNNNLAATETHGDAVYFSGSSNAYLAATFCDFIGVTHSADNGLILIDTTTQLSSGTFLGCIFYASGSSRVVYSQVSDSYGYCISNHIFDNDNFSDRTNLNPPVNSYDLCSSIGNDIFDKLNDPFSGLPIKPQQSDGLRINKNRLSNIYILPQNGGWTPGSFNFTGNELDIVGNNRWISGKTVPGAYRNY